MCAQRIKSEGKCIYCNKLVLQQGMTRHLSAHLKKLEEASPAKQTALHMVVSAGPYFLHLLVPAMASLKSVDGFLRKIWLECCGHLSAFSFGAWGNDAGMNRKLGDVFTVAKKLVHRYDFGSTTEADVETKGTYTIDAKGIELLSRNEPLPILCTACNSIPATALCSVHIYEGEGWYCDACAKEHEKSCEDFADYARMPVVNSPRTGVCGYEGGTIDTQRDGVYQV